MLLGTRARSFRVFAKAFSTLKTRSFWDVSDSSFITTIDNMDKNVISSMSIPHSEYEIFAVSRKLEDLMWNDASIATDVLLTDKYSNYLDNIIMQRSLEMFTAGPAIEMSAEQTQVFLDNLNSIELIDFNFPDWLINTIISHWKTSIQKCNLHRKTEWTRFLCLRLLNPSNHNSKFASAVGLHLGNIILENNGLRDIQLARMLLMAPDSVLDVFLQPMPGRTAADHVKLLTFVRQAFESMLQKQEHIFNQGIIDANTKKILATLSKIILNLVQGAFGGSLHKSLTSEHEASEIAKFTVNSVDKYTRGLVHQLMKMTQKNFQESTNKKNIPKNLYEVSSAQALSPSLPNLLSALTSLPNWTSNLEIREIVSELIAGGLVITHLNLSLIIQSIQSKQQQLNETELGQIQLTSDSALRDWLDGLDKFEHKSMLDMQKMLIHASLSVLELGDRAPEFTSPLVRPIWNVVANVASINELPSLARVFVLSNINDIDAWKVLIMRYVEHHPSYFHMKHLKFLNESDSDSIDSIDYDDETLQSNDNGVTGRELVKSRFIFSSKDVNDSAGNNSATTTNDGNGLRVRNKLRQQILRRQFPASSPYLSDNRRSHANERSRKVRESDLVSLRLSLFSTNVNSQILASPTAVTASSEIVSSNEKNIKKNNKHRKEQSAATETKRHSLTLNDGSLTPGLYFGVKTNIDAKDASACINRASLSLWMQSERNRISKPSLRVPEDSTGNNSNQGGLWFRILQEAFSEENQKSRSDVLNSAGISCPVLNLAPLTPGSLFMCDAKISFNAFADRHISGENENSSSSLTQSDAGEDILTEDPSVSDKSSNSKLKRRAVESSSRIMKFDLYLDLLDDEGDVINKVSNLFAPDWCLRHQYWKEHNVNVLNASLNTLMNRAKEELKNVQGDSAFENLNEVEKENLLISTAGRLLADDVSIIAVSNVENSRFNQSIEQLKSKLSV